mmetsp:Transcript_112679/g.297581  ORF Transcript_112679/g.297581 Transcript_112679/m.297581 type:complete len:578 (+) Transcript_112679:119-1852(+)
MHAAALSYPLTWLNFSVAWAGSWKIGAQFPNVVQLPMMVGYMFIGFVCSDYVTGMLYPETLHGDFSVASVVSHLSLAFIAMSAGAELDFFALDDDRVRQILSQIVFMGVLMVFVGTPAIYAMSAVMPASLLDQGIWCQWSAALMVAVVQWAGSVIEVLGIYYETQGQAALEGRPPGPVTQLMIGTTMLLDMVVLVFFAITQNVVVAACPLEDDSKPIGGSSWNIVFSVGMVFSSIFLWVLLGVALGCAIWLILLIPSPGWYAGAAAATGWASAARSGLVVATAGAAYQAMLKLNTVIPMISPDLQLLRVDPLLVCMISASFLIHRTDRRQQLREVLSGLAPVVMPPFFTVAGASLELGAIMEHAAAVPLLFLLRFAALALGSFSASAFTRQDDRVKRHVWMTLQSQSGVTLGLVAQMQMGLMGEQEWAKGTAAIITGCVVINQLVGPTLCRHGIRSAGESRAEEDELPDPGVDLDLRPALERQTSTVSRRRVSSRFKSDGSSLGEEAKARRARTASALTTMDGPEVSRTRNAMSTRIPEDVWEEEGASPSKFDDKQTGQYLCCDYVDGQEHEPEGML